MKKSLMLVLCMASIAVATPILSIEDAAAPDELFTGPSDEVILGIQIDPGLIGGTLNVVLSNEQGSLNTDIMTFNPNYSLLGIVDQPWDFPWQENVGSTSTYVSIGGGNFSTANGDERWVMDELVFHCESPTDVTISLVVGTGGLDYDEGGGYTDVAEGTILDTVVVHQPEPMTIALLGLGGLFLRRRK